MARIIAVFKEKDDMDRLFLFESNLPLSKGKIYATI